LISPQIWSLRIPHRSAPGLAYVEIAKRNHLSDKKIFPKLWVTHSLLASFEADYAQKMWGSQSSFFPGIHLVALRHNQILPIEIRGEKQRPLRDGSIWSAILCARKESRLCF